MVHVIHYLPELGELEQTYVQCLIGRMPSEQVLMFATAYRRRRKNPQTVLLASIIGLVAFPGLQRFWLGHIGIGFLHLFTWGLLFVGTISDLVRYETLALLYNQRVAREISDNLQLQLQRKGGASDLSQNLYLPLSHHKQEVQNSEGACSRIDPRNSVGSNRRSCQR